MLSISFTLNNTLNSEPNVEKKKFYVPGFEPEAKEWVHAQERCS